MTTAFAGVGERTDVGRMRKRNEDSLRVNRDAGLLAVADGLGGHPGGDVASGLAAETVERAAVDDGLDPAGAILAAHRAIVEAGRRGRGAPGMGTTCAACRLRDGRLDVAWVGDSRVYLAAGGELEQLSHDHSFVQALVDAGELAPEAMGSHPERHVLSQCLGSFELEPGDVGRLEREVAAGDRVLLCTDGLTGELDDDRLGAIVAAEPDDQRAADALVDAALAAGGHDNVTVIVATV